MVKRIAAAVLWFYAILVVWNMIAAFSGLSAFIGPIVAAGIAALVAGDPMHKIWPQRVATERISSRLHAINSEF